jgi:8-oxo-dGTP pyrophosphatase MutT (NUDIX family)
MNSIKILLQDALQKELPGDKAHLRMLPVGRRLRSGLGLSDAKMSSVLLLVYPENDSLFICLTKRPSTMKHHPGQISFPGGKVEKEDISAESAAMRETHEEIGVEPSKVEILGRMSSLYVEASRFTIQPFLAWSNKKPDFSVNNEEVEGLILFPLSDFILNEIILEKELETFSGLLKVKYYPWQDEVIWGATAMILSELIEILKRVEFDR